MVIKSGTKTLTGFVIVEEQLIHPLFGDTHGPLLLLQIRSLGLPHLFCLLDPVLNLLSMQGAKNLPEEVTLWKTQVVRRTLRFW